MSKLLPSNRQQLESKISSYNPHKFFKKNDIVLCTAFSVLKEVSNNKFKIVKKARRTQEYIIRTMPTNSSDPNYNKEYKVHQKYLQFYIKYIPNDLVICTKPSIIQKLKKYKLIENNKFIILKSIYDNTFKVKYYEPNLLDITLNVNIIYLEPYNKHTKLIKKKIQVINEDDFNENYYVGTAHGTDPSRNSYITLRPNQSVIMTCTSRFATLCLGKSKYKDRYINFPALKLLKIISNTSIYNNGIKKKFLDFLNKKSKNSSLQSNSSIDDRLCVYKNKVPNISLQFYENTNSRFPNMRKGIYSLPFIYEIDEDLKQKYLKNHINRIKNYNRSFYNINSNRPPNDDKFYDIFEQRPYISIQSKHWYSNSKITINNDKDLRSIINTLNLETGTKGFTLYIHACRKVS
jgi:hypothetical protein